MFYRKVNLVNIYVTENLFYDVVAYFCDWHKMEDLKCDTQCKLEWRKYRITECVKQQLC